MMPESLMQMQSLDTDLKETNKNDSLLKPFRNGMAISIIAVKLTVTDNSNNSNACMANVFVQGFSQSSSGIVGMSPICSGLKE